MFDDVTVVDVEHGTLLPTQRVVIVGNRIQAMGDTGAIKMPQGARVLDARGKYLIPGLWDMHVHTSADLPYLLLIANGVTGIRDCWSYVPFDTMAQWRRQILAGTRVGPPRQLLSEMALDEHSPCTRGTTGHQCVADTADAKRVVDSLKAVGVDFIKTYRLGTELYFAVAAAARQAHIPFGGHLLPGVATAIQASDSGASILDHVNSAGDLDKLCVGSQASVEKCQPVAERFQHNNTWWVPTLSRRIHFNRAATPNPGKRADLVKERFDSMTKQFWAGTAPKDGWLRSDSSAAAADSIRFFSITQRVDLPILAGTDVAIGAGDMWQMPPGFSIHMELAIYVTEGMTPFTALQAATLNPAKLLHATDSLGTVAPGKLADLVLLDANPLADITNTTTIRAVIANGRYFDRPELDQLLADVYTNARQGFSYWWYRGYQKAITIGGTPR